MSYQSYKAQVEHQRISLRNVLGRANALRHEARLPTRDIEAELAQECPLLPKEAWMAQQRDRRAFARFRREQLAKEEMPTLPAGADWQAQRALVFRRAFLEHQIRQTWLSRPHTSLSQTPSHHT